MKLNIDLSTYRSKLKTRKIDGKVFIWDQIRQKDIMLQPEELVRQLLILFLVNSGIYPRELIQVERTITVNENRRRYDVVVFNRSITPFLLVECKSFSMPLNQATFNQAAMYNMEMKAPFLLVSNGIDSYCASLDFENKTYRYIDHLPRFEEADIPPRH